MAESNNGNWHTAHRWAQFLSAYCDTALLKQWPAPSGEATRNAAPGVDYAGYFATGDDSGIAALVRRCAAEPDFLALLQRQCFDRASLFEPQSERRLVINLLACALNDPIGMNNFLPGTARI